MHISTFFNADLMKFHIAAILQIKMLETIQKSGATLNRVLCSDKFSVATEHLFPKDILQSKHRKKLILTVSFFKNLNSDVWKRLVSKRLCAHYDVLYVCT